ncbi:AhpC/TSA family protein [Actinoplanes flavus]|nr:AhpC/TSA family protein [Actinoplanes flavus]
MLSLTAVQDGTPVAVPDPVRIVHLQLRRFAGCPICHLHLRSFVRRHDDLESAGILEVVVFHSTADELRPHVTDLPFPAIADPERHLYRRFGAEPSARSLLDPRVYPSVVRAVTVGTVAFLRGRAKLPSRKPTGGRLGLPADVLFAPGGDIMARKTGTHADDQWSVDEVLELAR